MADKSSASLKTPGDLLKAWNRKNNEDPIGLFIVASNFNVIGPNVGSTDRTSNAIDLTSTDPLTAMYEHLLENDDHGSDHGMDQDSGHDDSGHDDSGHDDSGHGDSGHGDSGHDDSDMHQDSGHDDNEHNDNGHGDSGHDDNGNDNSDMHQDNDLDLDHNGGGGGAHGTAHLVKSSLVASSTNAPPATEPASNWGDFHAKRNPIKVVKKHRKEIMDARGAGVPLRDGFAKNGSSIVTMSLQATGKDKQREFRIVMYSGGDVSKTPTHKLSHNLEDLVLL